MDTAKDGETGSTLISMERETGIRAEVLAEITRLARQYDITRVLLFGSRARGDFIRVSDIDLAVQGGDITGFTLAVDEETSTLLFYDVVDLDGPVETELLGAIKREGRCLYEKI